MCVCVCVCIICIYLFRIRGDRQKARQAIVKVAYLSSLL